MAETNPATIEIMGSSNDMEETSGSGVDHLFSGHDNRIVPKSVAGLPV
jgi:hypothetical protein